jgi:hypothetical protein
MALLLAVVVVRNTAAAFQLLSFSVLTLVISAAPHPVQWNCTTPAGISVANDASQSMYLMHTTAPNTIPAPTSHHSCIVQLQNQRVHTVHTADNTTTILIPDNTHSGLDWNLPCR